MALSNGVPVNGDVKGENIPKEDTLTSPYTTRAINVRIGPNGENYTVLQALVEQYPGIQARMNPKKPGTPIELPEVHEDIAHTLIHFIYTKEYHTLGLGGVPENARAMAEFKRSVLAYCAARLCAIKQLEELTKAKMEHFSKQISVYNIQEVVAEVSGKLPHNEIWFPEHLYRWIKGMLQENDELVTDERLLDLVGKSPLFDKAVLRSVAEMYSEKTAALNLFSSTKVPLEEEHPDSETVPVINGNNTVAESHKEDATQLAAPVEEQAVEAIQAAPETTAEAAPSSATNGVSEHNVKNGCEVKSQQLEPEDWSVKAAEGGSSKTESILVPGNEPKSVLDSPTMNGREDELAKLENASKATDSDVEAARAKTGKKKKGKKKKSGSEI